MNIFLCAWHQCYRELLSVSSKVLSIEFPFSFTYSYQHLLYRPFTLYHTSKVASDNNHLLYCMIFFPREVFSSHV
jgi:hypothetical protein